jgi:hypothetical protein
MADLGRSLPRRFSIVEQDQFLFLFDFARSTCRAYTPPQAIAEPLEKVAESGSTTGVFRALVHWCKSAAFRSGQRPSSVACRVSLDAVEVKFGFMRGSRHEWNGTRLYAEFPVIAFDLRPPFVRPPAGAHVASTLNDLQEPRSSCQKKKEFVHFESVFLPLRRPRPRAPARVPAGLLTIGLHDHDIAPEL